MVAAGDLPPGGLCVVGISRADPFPGQDGATQLGRSLHPGWVGPRPVPRRADGVVHPTHAVASSFISWQAGPWAHVIGRPGSTAMGQVVPCVMPFAVRPAGVLADAEVDQYGRDLTSGGGVCQPGRKGRDASIVGIG